MKFIALNTNTEELATNVKMETQKYIIYIANQLRDILLELKELNKEVKKWKPNTTSTQENS